MPSKTSRRTKSVASCRPFSHYTKDQKLSTNKNTYKVQINTLDNYIDEKKILKIDFLKIDTEGYEYEVLNGLKKNFDKVRMILLEHHYDNMIDKGYKFADINSLLIENNFIKVFKWKMPFRKTFEYLYQNRSEN